MTVGPISALFGWLALAVGVLAAPHGWPGGPSIDLAFKLLPVAVITWLAAEPTRINPAAAFVAGLAVDALSGGPLGLLATHYTIAAILAPSVAESCCRRLLTFAVIVTATATVHVLLAAVLAMDQRHFPADAVTASRAAGGLIAAAALLSAAIAIAGRIARVAGLGGRAARLDRTAAWP